MDEKRRAMLKELPKIDEIMLLLEKQGIDELAPRELIKDTCRDFVQNLRETIVKPAGKKSLPPIPDAQSAATAIADILLNMHQYRLRRVINATGVVLHTNLGRAPLCAEALQRIREVSAGYCNLEFDLEKGERGLRYDHIRDLLCVITGAEDALVVNNNAAAVLLAINTLAEGKEAIVSRGELIEIGGEFRIPEVMAKSAARLREVGTTNRTRISDYEKAICDDTGLILKVHTSNFRIVGFTEEASVEALVELGKKYLVPVMNDLGSGCLIETAKFGLPHEPTVRKELAKGVDVLTCSGDKLLGGPQAGIILGKKEILAKIKKNPLNRALRIDKMTLAALEATLMHYLKPVEALAKIRSLKALTEPAATVKKRAQKLLALLVKDNKGVAEYTVKEAQAAVGGGALPTAEIPSYVVAVKPAKTSAGRLEERLRKIALPVIVRVDKDEIMIDLRTVAEEEFDAVVAGLRECLAD